MKRKLTLLFILICLISQAQVSPAKIDRIQNSTTQFGQTIPIGDIIFNKDAGYGVQKYYGVSTAQASTQTTSGAISYLKEFWFNGNPNISIGTLGTSRNITLLGTSAQTIGMEANSTAYPLTINAGGATGNDLGGADLFLQGGLNTGSGLGGAIRLQTSPVTTSGTGGLKTVTVSSGGYGYSTGQTLYLVTAGSASGARVYVDYVDGGGGVTLAHVTLAGTGYSVGSATTVTGGTGSYAAFNFASIISSAPSSAIDALIVWPSQHVTVGYSTDLTNYLFGVNGNAYFNGNISAVGATFTSGAGTGKVWTSNASGVGSWASLGGAVYKGQFSGVTGVPASGGSAIKDNTGTTGWYYACSTTGPNTYDYGNPSGNSLSMKYGDQIYYNGTIWLKIPGAGSYTLPTASNIALGGVKFDNTTVQMNGSSQLYIPHDGLVSNGSNFGLLNSTDFSFNYGYWGVIGKEPIITAGTSSQYWRGDKTWQTLPAAGTGTVTSVVMSVPTGLSISGSPITTSGTLALSLTSGYAIPTTANISTWNGLTTMTYPSGSAGNIAITGTGAWGTSIPTTTFALLAGAYGTDFHVAELGLGSSGSASGWTIGGSSGAQFKYGGAGKFTVDTSGNGTFIGTATGTNFILSSDRRMKENIIPLNRLSTRTDWTDQIQFVQFSMKSDSTHRTRYGVIAQEVEKVAPGLVYTDAKGMKSVGYTDLIIAKLATMELKIAELENQIKELKHEKK